LALAPLDGLAALIAAVAVAAAVTAWARRAPGGRTGDTLGATIALTELTVVVLLLGLARP
jgi:cobalamin synthase